MSIQRYGNVSGECSKNVMKVFITLLYLLNERYEIVVIQHTETMINRDYD